MTIQMRIVDFADMLQTSIDFSFEQGFIPQKPKVEELFAEQLRDL